MSILQKIEAFLEKKKTAWSTTTIKGCKAFLNNYGSVVVKGDAQALWDALFGKGRYTVQTYFVHAASFYEFLYPTNINVFREFRKDNRNVFKNAYQSKNLSIDYNTVKALLEAQDQSDEKEACLYILSTAQRSCEAGLARHAGLATNGVREHNGSTIIGKGGKERINLGADLMPAGHVRWNYYRVYRYLKRLCGISPHDLRKLALTRAGERGAGPADLCEIAGWSSIQTAYRYLQPKRAKVLKGYLD